MNAFCLYLIQARVRAGKAKAKARVAAPAVADTVGIRMEAMALKKDTVRTVKHFYVLKIIME